MYYDVYIHVFMLTYVKFVFEGLHVVYVLEETKSHTHGAVHDTRAQQN